MTADLAFAILINRTSAFYQASPPLYMTYIEHTHVSAPSLGRAQDIDRSIAVRIADNFAVMKDLPNGGWRTGEAFPIVAYFDPDIELQVQLLCESQARRHHTRARRALFSRHTSRRLRVNVVVPYNSYWAARYAPDSTNAALHLMIDPTPRVREGFTRPK